MPKLATKMPAITQQPLGPRFTMSTSGCEDKEESLQYCHSHEVHAHTSCHSARLRRLLIPVFFALLTLAAFVFMDLLEGVSEGGFVGAAGGLLRRAAEGSTNNGQQSPFVKNKCE